MTSDQFLVFQRGRPFEPFAIHLADGRSIKVRHPEAAALSGCGRTVKVINPDRLTEALDLLVVISLRPLNSLELRTRR
jgi:hypothetical protein